MSARLCVCVFSCLCLFEGTLFGLVLREAKKKHHSWVPYFNIYIYNIPNYSSGVVKMRGPCQHPLKNNGATYPFMESNSFLSSETKNNRTVVVRLVHSRLVSCQVDSATSQPLLVFGAVCIVSGF